MTREQKYIHPFNMTYKQRYIHMFNVTYEQRYTHIFDMTYKYDLKGSLSFIRLALFLLRHANITNCNKHFVQFLKSSRHVQCSEEWMSRVISLTVIHVFF